MVAFLEVGSLGRAGSGWQGRGYSLGSAVERPGAAAAAGAAALAAEGGVSAALSG